MRGPTIALSFLLLGGAAAGCSDDGDGGNAQPYVDAMVESLQEDDESGFTPTDEQATCVAEGTVDAIGADFLEENDVTPEALAGSDGPQDLDLDISEDQARGAASTFVDCDLPLAEAFAGEGASEEAVGCVDDNLDEDGLVDALTAQYLGDEDAADSFFQELFSAISEECQDLFTG